MCAARSDILLQSVSMKELLEALRLHDFSAQVKFNKIKPNVSALDTLSLFPFLSFQIPALKEEFPLYVAASEDILIPPMTHCNSGGSMNSLCLHGVRQ